MHPPPAHPPHQKAVIDLKLDGSVQGLVALLQQALQFLGLPDGAGEAVKYVT